jgi:hypothetical protein
VEKFINYRFNEEYISFPNRVNKVKRLIQKILGNNDFKLININVKESKNNNNKIIDEDEILTIFNSLDKCNSKAIYIIFVLLIIYGFTIRIISRLKRKNFHPLQYIIYINYNKIRKRKIINALVCQYILSYAFYKKIKDQDLLFFHDYKEVNSLSRENYINWRINNEFNKITNLKNKRLRIILNRLHSFRSSIRIGESFFISKIFFL